jgi:hypothetical protein
VCALCIAERYVSAQSRVQDVGDEPWKITLFGEIPKLLNAKVKVMVLGGLSASVSHNARIRWAHRDMSTYSDARTVSTNAI